MTRIDARGLRCPWPAVRLARALRGGAALVELRADDPQAATELAAVATQSGAILSVRDELDGPVFVVRAGGVNAPFTQTP